MTATVAMVVAYYQDTDTSQTNGLVQVAVLVFVVAVISAVCGKR